jgi:alkylation response protein AidB-like acyl-CoA dehydrogenase
MPRDDEPGAQDTPEEAAFRAEVRAFLDAHATPIDPDAVPVRHDDDWYAGHMKRSREWQRVLYEHGWAGISWPEEHGGRGASAIQQTIFNEEQARYDVSAGALSIGLGMVAPTLMVHGTDEQQRHLDAMLRGDEIWCQLYSEPGSGSDLASLATRAVLDGDEYVVNGQKVWNTYAQFADWGILLARTNPDAPKHRGITYFLVDMRTPGIDVRPLRQISGVAHFNEVFLNEVRIPKENVLGEVDNGWRVAHTTLGNERAMIGAGTGSRNAEAVVELARAHGLTGDPVMRQHLAEAWIRSELLRYFSLRLRAAMSRGETPGPEASVVKLAFSQHAARTGELVMRILGPEATLDGSDAPAHGLWQDYFLNQYQVRIGGGTDEVQKNTIGERVLGLPREPGNDREIPWRELARS